MRFRFRAPLATNPRMENLFERASFSRVSKDYMAKPLSIQLLIDRKKRTPKFASNLSFNLQIKIDKLMRGLIGVEKLGARKDLAETFAKAGLACGNSASDPDGRHLSEDQKRVRLSGFILQIRDDLSNPLLALSAKNNQPPGGQTRRLIGRH